MEAAKRLVARSLARRMRELVKCGIPEYGLGSGQDFLPKSVSEVAVVRLFVKPHIEDKNWMEVVGFSKYQNSLAGRDMVNTALKMLDQSRPPPKDYYGDKKTQIRKMFKYLVPEQYVPDEYEVASTTSVTNSARMPLKEHLLPIPVVQNHTSAELSAISDRGKRPAEFGGDASNANHFAAKGSGPRWEEKTHAPLLLHLFHGWKRVKQAWKVVAAHRLGLTLQQVLNGWARTVKKPPEDQQKLRETGTWEKVKERFQAPPPRVRLPR